MGSPLQAGGGDWRAGDEVRYRRSSEQPPFPACRDEELMAFFELSSSCQLSRPFRHVWYLKILEVDFCFSKSLQRGCCSRNSVDTLIEPITEILWQLFVFIDFVLVGPREVFLSCFCLLLTT